MATDRKKTRAGYEPSPDLVQAQQAWEAAVEEEKRLRHAYHKAIADEMVRFDLSQNAMAQHTPYTEPHIRNIALEFGVVPKRRRKSGAGEGQS